MRLAPLPLFYATLIDFGRLTTRNQDAICRTTAGLIKLMFPHRNAETLQEEELMPCLDLAIECRQRIIDQLKVIAPGESGFIDLKGSLRIRHGQT